MKTALMIAALATVLASLLTSASALAGDWEYGCQGKNAAGNPISFNRNQLLLSSGLSSPVPQLQLQADSISQYDAADGNSGFTKTMVFAHKWGGSSPDSKITLTELKSKTISAKHEEMKCTGGRVRDFDTTIMSKLIQVEGEGQSTEKVLLKCFEYSMSACG